jgi:restriction system protein
MNCWMVRCGSGSVFFDTFKNEGIAAIGWQKVGDLSRFKTREELQQAVMTVFPDYSPQTASMNTGQLFRFANEIQIGDNIVTYDSGSRTYLCGKVTGQYVPKPNEPEQGLANQRSVDWQFEVHRDNLTISAKNSLGSIATLFLIDGEVTRELWNRPSAPPIQQIAQQTLEAINEDANTLIGRSKILIQDKIAEMDWEAMQNLVAGLLRGMGYKTIVSPKGPDRGKDITASPDRLGFEDPRIVVEVKHRPEQKMGAPELRSFLGGRQPHEKGLYVSTGGFSQEARYEAERASIPVTLMDLDMMVDVLLEHYPQFDEATKRLLPLQQIYWPA